MKLFLGVSFVALIGFVDLAIAEHASSDRTVDFERKTISPQEEAEIKAVEVLADEIKKHVHETNHAVHTYHFVKKSEVQADPKKPLDLNEPKVKSHLKDWSAYFWNLNQPVDTSHIKGFYAATDPVASRTFGGDDWALWRVILPKGHRVFDLRAFTEPDYKKNYFSKELKALLKQAGCEADKFHYLFQRVVSETCHRISNKVLEQLGVESMLYGWVGAHFGEDEDRGQGAFIILKTDRIENEQVAIFSADSNDTDGLNEERKMIQELYRLARDERPKGNGETSHVVGVGDTKLYLWPTIEKPKESPSAWIREHLADSGRPLWD